MNRSVKRKLATMALAGLGAFTSGSALAGMTVDSNGGLEIFELDDTNYWFKIGGRLHLTQAFLDGSSQDRSRFPSGSRIPAARLTFKGGVGNAWVYKMDLDFNDNALGRIPYPVISPPNYNYPGTIATIGDAGTITFGEAFIGYNGCKNFWIALGQIGIPFGMESWASYNDAPFMENSMPSQAFAGSGYRLGPGYGYGLGIYGEWHNDMFTVAGAIYHPPAGTTQYGNVVSTNALAQPGAGPMGSNPGSDPVGYAARITFSPVHDDYAVYHLGIAAKYQNLHNNANNFNFYAQGDVSSRQSSILFSNIPFNSANNVMSWGFEAAGRWGPFMLAGEYMLAKVERDNSIPPNDPRLPGGDLKFTGFYLMASYVITGESKEYDFVSGTFGRVRPNSHKGAWEILIRHSYLDMVDNPALIPGSPITGNLNLSTLPSGIDPNTMVGGAHSTTLGINWWVNDNIRFLANFSRMNYPNSVDINGFGFKAIVNW